jgi:hypothetical protein
MKPASVPGLPAAEIRRLILNQKEEHSPHAFRAGGSAMADFRRLAPVFAALPPDQLANWLELIERMAETHRHCLPCSAKIRAYLLVFSRERLPELHARYEREFRRLALQGREQGRDYLHEVLNSLQGDDDSPAAAAHRRWWRSLAAELAEARALGLTSPLQP